MAVTGAGSEVYSSADRLYVTSTDWPAARSPADGPDTITRSDVIAPRKVRTRIHAFALDGDSTRYVASGVVDGSVRDRWSLDEHDGHLRVAVSWQGRTGSTRENGVVVLAERGNELEQVGELRGLGVDEEIQSVRWFDDLAVVVTFRQMDPLYTIDLSDPTRPRRLGALKIPGFSAYLHPIGDDRLLGIGSDATDERREPRRPGRRRSTSATRRDARQVGKVTFGRDSWFEAAEDPHAFTWLPDGRRRDRHPPGRPRLERRSCCGSPPTARCPRRTSPRSAAGAPARSPCADGRVALAGDRVEIVDVG